MRKESIKKIFERFKRNNPTPTTELIYHNPFELLVSVILSAQATDISVNKATAKLFAAANTPKAILALGEEGLIAYIQSIGLFRSKARHIIKMCEILITKYQNSVPTTREELEALPGVGRKTANVILNTLYQHPVIAVDTHIFRVAQRIGLVKGKTPLIVENELMKVVPEEYLHDAHHWLILHGRYICKAKKPMCASCYISDLCEYKDKEL